MSHHHRPTLKQSNKAFKSKHASKGSLKDAAKGRTGPSTKTSTTKTPSIATLSSSAHLRLNRRNAAKQAQAQKRDNLISAKRIFGRGGVPRIVCVVKLTEDVDVREGVKRLLGDEVGSFEGLSTIPIKQYKTALQFLFPTSFFTTLDACKIADYVLLLLSPDVQVGEIGETMFRALQAQGLPRVVACVVGPTQPGPLPKQTRSSLLSYTRYFVPSVSKIYDLSVHSESVNALRGLCEGVPTSTKVGAGRAVVLGEQISGWAPGDDEALGTLKITGTIRGSFLDPNRLVHIPGWGDYQVDRIVAAPTTKDKAKSKLNSNPNVCSTTDIDFNEESHILAEPTPSEADSLISTNPDADAPEVDLAREQTWPSEEEMMGLNEGGIEGDKIPDASSGTTPKSISKKRIPKGMSAYQASWIVDEDEDDADADGVDGEVIDEEGEEREGEWEDEEEDAEEMVDAEGEGEGGKGDRRKQVTFEDLPQDEEDRQLASWRQKDHEDERTHSLFPDEIDTPLPPALARTRFARYRGLRSFRTSPWDEYEALPREYGRVYAFGGGGKGKGNAANAWRKHEARIVKDREERERRLLEMDLEQLELGETATGTGADDDVDIDVDIQTNANETGTGTTTTTRRVVGNALGVEEGTRVTVVLKGVPKKLYDYYQGGEPVAFPPILFSLFPHEHKMTVLNFTVTRNTEYEGSVRSKDPLILCIGPRRLHVNPVYSTFEGGKPTPNNVHKFERYLQHGTTSMATVYAPVVVGSGRMPCFLVREEPVEASSTSSPFSPPYHLVASGTFISPDPNRIIAKRIILTGHPFKVHKKTATVRYMFFDRDDVTYFAPIQLHTKHGRTGHIKESLGTHGYFKAHFDGPISQMDTVCMNLYKRVFPKWSRGVEALPSSSTEHNGSGTGAKAIGGKIVDVNGGEAGEGDVVMN